MELSTDFVPHSARFLVSHPCPNAVLEKSFSAEAEGSDRGSCAWGEPQIVGGPQMPCQESHLQVAKAGINGQRRAPGVLGPISSLLLLEGVGWGARKPTAV